MKKKNGFALIATIFIIMAMTFLMVTTSAFIPQDSVIAVRNFYSQDAFYIASSGVEFYLRELENDLDWSTPPPTSGRNFCGGRFEIQTTDEAENRITFTVTGLLTLGATYERAIRTTARRTIGGGLSDILGEYVLYWAGGTGEGSTIGNNVDITGNIFIGSDVSIGSNTEVDGDVESGGDVDLGWEVDINGTIEVNADPPYNPPTLETTYYDDLIAIAAAQAPGDWEFLNTSLVNETHYINGNVLVWNNGIIDVTGTSTIVATGGITLTNNVVVDDNLHVIVGGNIDIANNVNIGQNGVWYSSVYIEMGNNAEVGTVVAGEGTQFITPGDMWFGNNAEFYGFIYCGGDLEQSGNNFYFEGNMIVGGDAQIDNNATLTLNSDLVAIGDIIGVGGASTEAVFELAEWDEVY